MWIAVEKEITHKRKIYWQNVFKNSMYESLCVIEFSKLPNSARYVVTDKRFLFNGKLHQTRNMFSIRAIFRKFLRTYNIIVPWIISTRTVFSNHFDDNIRSTLFENCVRNIRNNASRKFVINHIYTYINIIYVIL